MRSSGRKRKRRQTSRRALTPTITSQNGQSQNRRAVSSSALKVRFQLTSSRPVPTTPHRSTTSILDATDATPSFRITSDTDKSYKYQYSNIYFTRLSELRKPIEERALKRWANVDGAYHATVFATRSNGVAGKPRLVRRVLEVVKSQLCYIVGTVYMDMPLKPNVLEDIARDVSHGSP